MRRAATTLTLTILTAGVAAACAVNLGGPRDFALTTVGLRTVGGTTVAQAAESLRGAEVALVASPSDAGWFSGLAQTTGLHLSGPAVTDDGLGLAFLAMEPVGDTIIRLAYDGGTFELLDALYSLDDEGPYLDLMAFRVERAADARPMIRSLLQYVATDVMASSAVVFAVAVPTAAVGDSVARMFSPAYFDAARCDGEGAGSVAGIRLFYGPEARMYCQGASAAAAAGGEVVRATLVVGRR